MKLPPKSRIQLRPSILNSDFSSQTTINNYSALSEINQRGKQEENAATGSHSNHSVSTDQIDNCSDKTNTSFHGFNPSDQLSLARNQFTDVDEIASPEYSPVRAKQSTEKTNFDSPFEQKTPTTNASLHEGIS